MNCLDQNVCRTFSDANGGQTCVDNVNATGDSQAAKDFLQNGCTACGWPFTCSSFQTQCAGGSEIVPYLTDADIASLATCASSACTLNGVINSCTGIPDVAEFAACVE